MADDLLSLETRRRIYEAVRRAPGLGAREAQRAAGTGWGETVYHLDRLTHAQLVFRERGSHQDRYFASEVPPVDRRLLGITRSASARRLLVALLETPGLTVPDLEARTGLSAGRLSVHLRRLLAAGVICGKRRGRLRTFHPVDPERIARWVVASRPRFSDEWIERFLSTWSEIFRV